MIKLYKVGGCVRDSLIGVESKDIDYAVEAESFEEIEEYVKERGEIFPVPKAKENFTIRGRVKELGGAVDFVWCRKEGPYSDGRRPDWVKPGTLMDDLTRRDFTMNAIAQDLEGNLIDPFDGQTHIKFKLIVAVGNAYDRFYEDALRMLRAVRFSVTKRFIISPEVEAALCNEVLLKRLRENIAEDRVKDEITKMFQHDVIRAAHMLFEMNPALARTIFTDDRRLWLKPTLEAA